MVSREPPEASDNAAAFAWQRDDVFGRIASRYDALCDVFSLGIHRLWKARVARTIAREPWTCLLDGATGTGDIILRVLAHQSVAGRCVIASDLSQDMLAMARRRLAGHGAQVRFQQLNAESMPGVPSASVDAYSISLALKICHRRAALEEALRVLRPGGRLVVLEASNIPWRPLQAAYLAYMAVCMPVLGWLATRGDASAYRYLLQGIREFPSAEQLAAELEALGFVEVGFERLSLGIVAIHTARKPVTPELGRPAGSLVPGQAAVGDDPTRLLVPATFNSKPTSLPASRFNLESIHEDHRSRPV